jgi:hypothetical protein
MFERHNLKESDPEANISEVMMLSWMEKVLEDESNDNDEG